MWASGSREIVVHQDWEAWQQGQETEVHIELQTHVRESRQWVAPKPTSRDMFLKQGHTL